MHEVADGVEVRRPRGAAEAGVRRGDDLGVAAEEIDKGRARIDVLEPVEEQERPARAAPQDLEIESADRQALGAERAQGARHRPLPRQGPAIGGAMSRDPGPDRRGMSGPSPEGRHNDEAMESPF